MEACQTIRFSPSTGLISNDDFLRKVIEIVGDLPTVTTNKDIIYYNVPAAFDIEVSSFYLDGQKCACMYVWQFGLLNWVTYGRTWDEFEKFMQLLSAILGLNHDRRLVIYIHNFAYEFQFIRKRIKWDQLFFLEKRKPIYGISGGYEYRCSLKLSGKSLKKVGDDLQKYKAHKKTGDLDYALIRTSTTPLTETELGYCEADIRVLLAYIQEKIEQDGNITLIPYTNTGYVRNYCRKACLSPKNWKWYRLIMKSLTIEPDEYIMLKEGFQGGFTHASAKYSRRVLKDVGSFDFTSSYPAVMLAEKFPMSKGRLVNQIDSAQQFYWYLENYCCLFRATFHNLQEKLSYDNPISSSKLLVPSQRKEASLNNGRVRRADEATLTMTEQDFGIYEAFYTWSSMDIHKMYIYEKKYLPTSFVKAILKLYKDKTKLKDVEGEEINYMISKNMLNSAYGMTVTDIVRPEIKYEDDEYDAEEQDLEKALKAYNESVKRFLFYPWGVWVTAYARKNLFSGIYACGDDYIYADTDSIKVRNYRNHLDYIEAYNESIQQKLALAAKHHKIDPAEFGPPNRDGIPKPIGVWEFEGEYARFKTVGAKRYLLQTKDGKYKLTISGVNKKLGVEYLQKAYKDPMDGLDEGLIVPGEYSGRLLLDYCGDRPCAGVVTDYLGNVGTFEELSYIHMEPTTYELTYSPEYKAYIDYLLDMEDDSW